MNTHTVIGDPFNQGFLGNVDSVFIDRKLECIWLDDNDRNVKKIELGNNITEICEGQFRRCKKLTSIAIPANITTIGERAFEYCSALEEVTVFWMNPFTINDNVFSTTTYETANLLVPNNTVDTYAMTGGWKNFKNIHVYSYSVTAQTTVGGTLTIEGKQVTSEESVTVAVKTGSSISIAITPDEGYELASITENGTERISNVINGVLIISNVQADLTI